jgi:hypothetical protein
MAKNATGEEKVWYLTEHMSCNLKVATSDLVLFIYNPTIESENK